MARDGIGVMAALVVVSLAACSGGQQRDARDEILRQRLDAVEKRLGSLEKRIGLVAAVADRLGTLEGRMAALEARPAPVPTARNDAPDAPIAQPAQPSPLWTPPATAPGDQDGAVAALRQEYEARLAEIQSEPTLETRQQAVRELSQWYAAQYRALTGTPSWNAEK